MVSFFSDIIKATFPGASITGAPKIRAMEIIDETEPVRKIFIPVQSDI
jgi:para-aminobenzoate synthetase component 1